MRSQTGFFERKSKKTVNQKLRKKILESPGGFEVDLPIIMDIVAEARPPLEMSLEYQALIAEEARGRDSFYGHPYDSIVVSTNQLSIAQPGPVQDDFSSPVLSASGSPSLFPTSSSSPSLYPISSPSQSSFSVSSPSTPSPAVTRIQDPFSVSSKTTYVPQTKYVRTVPPRYSTLLPSFKPRGGGGGGESSQGSSSFSGEPSSRSHTLPVQLPYSSSSSSSAFRTSATPITDSDLFFKPLPTIPPSADNTHSPSLSAVQRQQQAPSSPYTPFGSTAEPSSTTNDSRISGSFSTLNNNLKSPPPAHPSYAGTSNNSSYGYYPEKSVPLPDDSLYFSRLVAVGIQQNATAPNAVDLGVGPMSPPTSFTYISPPSVASPAPSFSNIGSSTSTTGHDYRTYVSLPPQQETAGYQSIPPQPTLYRYHPMASASAPRLYSPDYSQAAEPVPVIPSSASSIPLVSCMPPRPPADAGQSDQSHLYKLTDHPSPQPVPSYMH